MRSMHRSDVVRRTSDAEITRPQNEVPFESPPLPAWHVHLELQPDELVTLHRLGFTGGALAWREGMPEWQPIRVGDGAASDGPDANPAAREDSLSQPIPLTRRTRTGSGSIPPIDRTRIPFGAGRASAPPIASAMAVPRERPELILPPPPPPIEARGSVPEPASSRVLKLVQPFSAEPSPPGMVREPQPPPSIPPMALETKMRVPPRGVSSRALWWGAAALVALSASNGALVSALLWSLRHDFGSTPVTGTRAPAAASAAASTSAPSATACATSDLAGATLSAQTGGLRGSPVSIDQLPLVDTAARGGDRNASEHAATNSSQPTAAAANNATAKGANARKGPTRPALNNEPAPPRRVDAAIAAAAGTPGPVDRNALAQAVGRATGAASSCAEGPQKGRVALTFSPSGSVSGVTLEQSFGEPGINSCVLRAMGRARVHAFVGEPVTVHKTVAW